MRAIADSKQALVCNTSSTRAARPRRKLNISSAFCSLITLSALAACSGEAPVEPLPSPAGAGGGVTDDNGGAPNVTPPAAGSGGEQSAGMAGDTNGGSGGTPVVAPASCDAPQPGEAPLRRLTQFEYTTTMQKLVGTESSARAGDGLPAELLGNGFGNDAAAQPSSAFLIEQYASIAERIAGEAMDSAEFANRYAPCLQDVTAETEAACADQFVRSFGASAFRRPLADEEVSELLAIQEVARGEGDFSRSIALAMQTMLQSPDFLYRVELGEVGADGYRRPTNHEMATRLSYLFRGGPPDEALLAAANAGELSSAEGVRAQAERLIETPEAREVVGHFFESYLPIGTLTDLTRDAELFPTFSGQIGKLMHDETMMFLDRAVFEEDGNWEAILTAPYTYMNETLAKFYGVEGVTGEEFRRVDIDDTTKRLGLLTQGALLTGTTITNVTNPVRRGGFLLNHVLCMDVPLPSAEVFAMVKIPDPYSGDTGRERYEAHSKQAVCAGCHALLDPMGFALENFDAVGLWRDQENGVTIDATGSVGALPEPFDGPVELVRQIAASPKTHACFARNWQTYAYGREITVADKCSTDQLEEAFAATNHNVKQLLINLTQTDAFLYLPEGVTE